jgi:hypothetical protein
MKYMVELSKVRVFIEVDAEGPMDAARKAWEGDGQVLFGEGDIHATDVKPLPENYDLDTGTLGESFDRWDY